MKTIVLLVLLLVAAQSKFKYTMSTRYVNEDLRAGAEPNEEFGNALREQVINAEQTEGYCTLENFDLPFSNHKSCGKSDTYNIGYVFDFWFDEAEPATWKIQFGTDFGRGAAVWANDEFQFARTDDLWWAGNWNSGDVFNLEYNFQPGSNHVQVIGSEYCCDGDMNIQFYRNSVGPKQLSPDNLNCAIPEPQSLISIESRPYPGTIEGECFEFGENLAQAFWSAPENAEGYCYIPYPQWPISNNKDCNGGKEDIIWLITFEFSLTSATNIQFELGLDFGLGTAVYVDHEWKQTRTDDIWWSDNWEHEDVLSINRSFAPGFHTLEVYGLEGCCDGNQAVKFKVEGQEEFQDLTASNWQAAVPPSPPSFLVVETRQYNGTPDGSDEKFAYNLVDVYDNAEQPDGYCTAENPNFPFSNQSLCKGPNEFIIWRFEYTLIETEEAAYSFRFGTDFGKGAAWFLNGDLIDYRTDDLWWNGNWDSSDVFYFDFTSKKGFNQLEIYGAEGCCDGNFDIQFSRNGGDYVSVNQLGEVIPNRTADCGAQSAFLIEKQKSVQSKTRTRIQKVLKKN